MPRFYFDVFDGEITTPDKIGLDVEDGLERIRDLAVDALPDLAREKLPDGDRAEFTVTVRDEDGSDIFRAVLSFRVEWIDRTKG
jgi:uncharacterized protein DUF6894